MKIFIGVEEHPHSDDYGNPIESTYTLLVVSLTRDGAIEKLLTIQRNIIQDYIDIRKRYVGYEKTIADVQKRLDTLRPENFSDGFGVYCYQVLEMDTDE